VGLGDEIGEHKIGFAPGWHSRLIYYVIEFFYIVCAMRGQGARAEAGNADEDIIRALDPYQGLAV
jgi:hypothetical protein